MSKGQFGLLVHVKKIKNKKLLAYLSGRSPTFLATSVGSSNSSTPSFMVAFGTAHQGLSSEWRVPMFDHWHGFGGLFSFRPSFLSLLLEKIRKFSFYWFFNLILIIFIVICFAFDCNFFNSFLDLFMFFNFFSQHFIWFNFCIQFWSSFFLLIFFYPFLSSFMFFNFIP